MACVYLLRDPSTNLIKIGRAKNFVERFTNLKTANPRLEVAHLFENINAVKIESYLHKKFAIYQKEGEFFDIPVNEVIRYGEKIIKDTSILSNPDLSSLEQVHATTPTLDPKKKDWELVQKLTQIDTKINELELEREILIAKLKLQIGTAAGINQLVSWKNRTTVRFDQIKFRENHEDLFEKYKTTFVSRTFKYHLYL